MPRSTGRKKRSGRIEEATAVYAAPALTKVTRHGQITLPSEVRRAMGIEEGDLIEVRIAGDNVMLTPKRLIDKSQAYFWTPEWQAAESEAQADIDAGRLQGFGSAKDLFEDLDA